MCDVFAHVSDLVKIRLKFHEKQIPWVVLVWWVRIAGLSELSMSFSTSRITTLELYTRYVVYCTVYVDYCTGYVVYCTGYVVYSTGYLG